MAGIGIQRVGDGLYFYAVTKNGPGRLHLGWEGFQRALAEYVMAEKAGWFELLSQFAKVADLRAADVGLPHNWKFEADERSNALCLKDPAGVVVVEDCASIAEAVRAAKESVDARRQPTSR